VRLKSITTTLLVGMFEMWQQHLKLLSWFCCVRSTPKLLPIRVENIIKMENYFNTFTVVWFNCLKEYRFAMYDWRRPGSYKNPLFITQGNLLPGLLTCDFLYQLAARFLLYSNTTPWFISWFLLQFFFSYESDHKVKLKVVSLFLDKITFPLFVVETWDKIVCSSRMNLKKKMF
jgi:hypothetical protein